jgi:uncharacterized protein (DUF4415 family)
MGRKIVIPDDEEEAMINAGIAADPDTFELTEEDFARARPAREVLYELLPKAAAEALLAPKKTGRPLGSGKKAAATMRLDKDILETFRATGRGWQTRLNNALRDWLKEHRP